MVEMHLDGEIVEITCEGGDDAQFLTNDEKCIFIQLTSKDDFRKPFPLMDDKVVKSITHFYELHLLNKNAEFWFISDCGIRIITNNK